MFAPSPWILGCWILTELTITRSQAKSRDRCKSFWLVSPCARTNASGVTPSARSQGVVSARQRSCRPHPASCLSPPAESSEIGPLLRMQGGTIGGCSTPPPIWCFQASQGKSGLSNKNGLTCTSLAPAYGVIDVSLAQRIVENSPGSRDRRKAGGRVQVITVSRG